MKILKDWFVGVLIVLRVILGAAVFAVIFVPILIPIACNERTGEHGCIEKTFMFLTGIKDLTTGEL